MRNKSQMKYRKSYYKKTAYSDNSMKKWSPWEIKMLSARITDKGISLATGRSVGSIQVKRNELGLHLDKGDKHVRKI